MSRPQGVYYEPGPLRELAMMHRTCTIVLCLLVASTCAAAERSNRVALVIGNAAYEAAPLRNPVNDAHDVGQTLQRLGFEVTTLLDADHDAMESAIVGFAERLDEETVGLFYYAGHGVQFRGRNFLVPTDAELQSERAFRFEAIAVNAILEEMAYANNRVNIVILDACRNNPFERRFRGASRGLAAIDAARGTLIAYATAPGSVAADGDGENGLYTSALLRALTVPGLKAEEVFKRVRVAVTDETNGQQVPWESSSLTGDFVFNAVERAEVTRRSAQSKREELLFWESIKDADRPEYYRAYLDRYPDGAFATIARLQIDKLAGHAPTVSTSRSDATTAAGGVGIAESQPSDGDSRPTAGAALASAKPPAEGPPQSAPSNETYTVALLRPAYFFAYASDPGYHVNDLETDVRVSIKEMSGFRLEYSDIGEGHVPGTGSTPDETWTGGIVHKTPNLEPIYRIGQRLGVEAIVTWWANPAWDHHEWPVELYVIDIREKRVYERKTTNVGIRSLMGRILAEFKSNRAG